MPRVKAQRGDGVRNEGVGSVKWALEGHEDPLKHLILPEGTAGQGKWAAY